MKSFILLITIFFASLTAMGQVCQIGSTNYNTLDDALAVVQNGGMITILTDITYDKPMDLGNKSITFYFNGLGTSLTIDASATTGSAALTTSGDLYLSGSGFFNIKAADIGINLTGTGGTQILSLNHKAATTIIQTTGTGADCAAIASSNDYIYIAGTTDLRLNASGTSGDAIRMTAANARLDVTGSGSLGLLFTARGSGAGHGINFVNEGNHTVNIDFETQSLNMGGFYGGASGNGINSPGEAGTLTVNNRNGEAEITGQNGIYTKSNLTLGCTYTYGFNYTTFSLTGGSGCGIKLDNIDKTLSVAGSVGATGGAAGLWLGGNTTISTGDYGFYPTGGSSGIYVDADGATLTISTSSANIGNKWFGGSAANDQNDCYGIYAAGALTLKQSGSYRVDIKGTGGKNNEGVFVESGKDLTLSGNLTLEADGGANAKGINAGTIIFDNANQKLTIGNNSGSEETAPCSRTFSPAPPLYWTTVGDGDISTADDDANDAVTFALPASTGTTKSASIFFTNGIPIVYTTGTLPFGIVNTPYSVTLSATNNITGWNVDSGTLPDGLTLDNSGRITGTPTATGYYTFKVTATGKHGTCAPVTFYISIQDFVAVTDIQLSSSPSVSIISLPYYLYGYITPYDATYNNIIWTVESAGTTGASITFDGYSYYLYATAAGKATIRATIVDGAAVGTNYTKDFIISITDDVCQIIGGDLDGTKYKNLQDGLNALDALYYEGKDTPVIIKLLDDISGERTWISMHEITFDLNGHDMTFSGGEGGCFSLQDSKVDYTGAGNFKVITTYSGTAVNLNGNSSCALTSIDLDAQGTNGIGSYSSDCAFTGDINGNAEYTTGMQVYDTKLVFNGNIIINNNECTGVNANGSSEVTVNGKIEAPHYIIINGIEKTPADKEAVSSKPSYDEYTDGSSYVWVKQSASTPNFKWQGTTDSNWNTESNWAGGQVPSETDVVVIQRNATYFPILQNPVSVAEIHFEPGAQIGNQHLLDGKVFVQYDFSQEDSRNRWNMLSMPLGQAYPGDFAFGGYPVTWVRTFETVENGSLTEGVWKTAKARTTPLSFGDGFVLWLNDDNKTGMGLSLLNGIHELPSFQNFIPGSENYGLYKKVNQAHEYDKDSGISTFHSFDLVGGEYVVGSLSYEVARNDSANLLLKEDFSKDLNFLSNGEAGEGSFDLVGNPYMAGLDFDALSAANENVIKPCYQIWTGEGYESYSPFGASGFVGENTLSGCIAPLQAFLVEKPESPESNALQFTEAMTTVTNPVSLRSADNSENKLNIVAGNPVAKTLAFIANREGGQDEFGNLDARKIMNGMSDIPDIYTLKPYKDGAVAVGANIIGNDEQLIPVGLATSYAGAITLSFSGMDTYNANLSLIDAEANKEIDLTGLPVYDYSFDYAPKQANGEAAACEDRFFIRISKSVTGLQETLTGKVNVFETNGMIRVVSGASDPIREVAVYNLQGALMYRATALDTISHTIDKHWITGVYIVKVYSGKNTGNFKLIVH